MIPVELVEKGQLHCIDLNAIKGEAKTKQKLNELVIIYLVKKSLRGAI